jgi:biotin carboxyl carrier protein
VTGREARAAVAAEDPGALAVRATLDPSTAVEGVEEVIVAPDGFTVADGAGLHGRLDRSGGTRGTLRLDGGEAVAVLLPPVAQTGGAGATTTVVEVVVDGWRFVVHLEPARRAALRARATRGRVDGGRGARAEVRAIIPGRVVSVAVAEGDTVEEGSELLVVEAMKMQNELRAPRAGTVTRVAVAAGQTIDVGDVLAVIE